MNIFIGNLSFEATEADVYKIFIKFGAVTSLSIVKEKKGIKSRGFGFLEMPDEEQAKAAITALNGKEFMGRELNVSFATSKAGPPGTRKKQHLRSEGYKNGRRTRSFMRRATAEFSEDPAPWKSKSWRKDQVQSKPWRRIEGQPKPWQRTEETVKEDSRPPWKSKPWQKKDQVQSKPWRRNEGNPKPWQKTEGSVKEGSRPPWKSKPWKKDQEPSKPWMRSENKPKPWRKTEEVAKEGSRPRWKAKNKSGGYKR